MSVTSGALRSIERAESGRKKIARGPLVLTQRDRELFVHLAVVRCLTTKQIRELLFPDVADSIARRRLCRLASGEHPYLRRVPVHTRADGPAVAWFVTPLGHLAASNLIRSIPDAPSQAALGSEFVEDVVRLNDLYVALAAAATHARLPLGRWPFRWLGTESVRLPWTERGREGNSPAQRAIYPDAALELPHQKRRIFIEVENRLHALGLPREGSTSRDVLKLKIERYTRFVLMPLTNLSNQTAYLQAFPDGWNCELLFIVPTPSLRNAVLEYIARTWRPTNEAVQLTISAFTRDEAAAALQSAAGLRLETALTAPAADSAAALSPEEGRVVYEFYNSAISTIAAVRQFLKTRPEMSADFPHPEYPGNHELMKAICVRLARRLAQG